MIRLSVSWHTLLPAVTKACSDDEVVDEVVVDVVPFVSFELPQAATERAKMIRIGSRRTAARVASRRLRPR